MSRNPNEPRFIFHGNAMPFGGRIEAFDDKLHNELIKGPPSAAVPVTGGWSVAASAGSNHRDWFQWGASVADCKGEWLGGEQYRTTVISQVADLTARNEPFVFQAELLRLKIVSNHDGPFASPQIRPSEMVFQGLRLDGHEITVHMDQSFADFPGYTQFEEKYQTDEAFFDKFHPYLKHPQGPPKFRAPLPLTRGGFVPASFVRRLEWKGQPYEGHVLPLKGFGNIYFGEVLQKADNRRVTLVRLEMGCTLRASAAGGEGDPNGTWG